MSELTFPRTKEELKQRLKEEDKKPRPIITADEYTSYKEKSLFKCPIKRDPRDCDGKPCPSRSDNSYKDYFEECIGARHARNRLRQILNGEILISNSNNGWEIPV